MRIKTFLPKGHLVDSRAAAGTSESISKGTSLLDFGIFSNVIFNIQMILRKQQLNNDDKQLVLISYQSISSFATKSDREFFRRKIPVSEIKCWLDFTIAEIKRLSTLEDWIKTGDLEDHDQSLLYAALAIMRHEVPMTLAFHSQFFQVLAGLVNALGNGRLPAKNICSLITSIVTTAFITSTIKCIPRWDVETTFIQLEASGMLREYLRCVTVPKGTGSDESTELLLFQLQSCYDLLSNRFVRGKSCGNTLHAILQGRDGCRNMSLEIFQKLQWISYKVQELEAPRPQLVNGSFSNYKAGVSGYKSIEASLSAFMQKNYIFLMIKMLERCDEKGLKMKDMVVELEFMENKDGIIPATQDPPIFKVFCVKEYLNGSRLKGIDWLSAYARENPLGFHGNVANFRGKDPGPNGIWILVRHGGHVASVIQLSDVLTEDALNAFREAKKLNFVPMSKVLPSDMLHSAHSMIQKRAAELEGRSRHLKAPPVDLKMYGQDLNAFFRNFLQIHYARLMARIAGVCNRHNLEIGDVVCELDWMPNKHGVIPAMQDPPEFNITPYWSYVDGSRFKQSDWFINHRTPDTQEKLKRTAMKLMLREFGKPAMDAKFILHYADTVAVVPKVPGIADKEALEAFRGVLFGRNSELMAKKYGQKGIRMVMELHWIGALSRDDLRVFVPDEVLWGLQRRSTF